MGITFTVIQHTLNFLHRSLRMRTRLHTTLRRQATYTHTYTTYVELLCATAALQRAGRQPESVRECRPALAHSELAVDGVLKRLAASGGQLITARLNDGLVARRPLEVDRGAPAASTVDTVSIRSAHGPRATIVRATTRGGAATP